MLPAVETVAPALPPSRVRPLHTLDMREDGIGGREEEGRQRQGCRAGSAKEKERRRATRCVVDIKAAEREAAAAPEPARAEESRPKKPNGRAVRC